MKKDIKMIFFQVIPLLAGLAGAVLSEDKTIPIMFCLFSAGIGVIPSDEDIENIVKGTK